MNPNTSNLSTSTGVASSPLPLKTNEVPESFSYIVDVILVIAFLLIVYFTKPQDNKENELTEEEKPNPLEQVLRTDPVEEEKKEEE